MTTPSEYLPSYPDCTVQVRGISGTEPERLPAQFRGVEGKRLSLVTDRRVAASSVITVEYNDCLFLGEVMAATEDIAGQWHLEAKVGQILTGLQSLMNLRANLLGESVSPFARETVRAMSR